MKRLLALLTLLPAAGIAESVPPWPVTTRIQNIISAVGPNWNGNANYKAALIREGEFAALYIFQGPYDDRPLVYAPQVAITGPYWSMVPWLEFDEGGTLILHSENRAFGRNKWESTLSIVERDGEFIVSAYGLSAYDSLDLGTFTDCSIDMLAQTMSVNETSVIPFPLPIEVKIQDWTEAHEGFCYKDYKE